MNETTYDDFEAALSAAVQKRTGAGASFGAELIPLLIQVITQALTSCLGQTTPASVAERATKPTGWDRRLMEINLRQRLYDGSVKEFRQDKGADLAAAVFDACQTVGAPGVAALVSGGKRELDWVM